MVRSIGLAAPSSPAGSALVSEALERVCLAPVDGDLDEPGAMGEESTAGNAT